MRVHHVLRTFAQVKETVFFIQIILKMEFYSISIINIINSGINNKCKKKIIIVDLLKQLC